MSWETRESSHPGPYFFLSYAHSPLSPGSGSRGDFWVEKLFRDLCDELMQLTDFPAGAPIGFMDRELALGEAWSERLGEALTTCRVFVPLYSPRYFKSEYCGREWAAFAEREVVPRDPDRRRARSAIVPAVWVPVPPHGLPSVAAGLQFNHSDLGADYAREGLYSLTKLAYFRDAYELAVHRLARRIIEVGESTVAVQREQPHLEDLASAFDSPRTGRDLRIVVVAPTDDRLPPGRSGAGYGPSALDWNPYPADSSRPLATLAVDLARSLGLRALLGSFDEMAAELLRSDTPEGPVLLLIDRWALRDPIRRRLLSALDSTAAPWISAVVAWSPDDPEDSAQEAPGAAELEEVIPGILKQGRSASRAAISGVRSLADFREAFTVVVHRALAQFSRYAPDPPFRPPSGPSGPSRRPTLRSMGPPPEPPPPEPPEEEAPGERRP
ncbi:TIR-like protein FxsC [Streptacidiphilus sp. N1-12]|uniref:TIR-like protein FxsC n=2 Tax=Streptacidiphilus alkalitolerans TaxID=3342712 RepID=A0ABV6WKI4_9ACTN